MTRPRPAALTALIAGIVLQATDGPFSDYRSQAPGEVHRITVDDLPRPYATPAASNHAMLIARPEGALPLAPVGFAVDQYVRGLQGPRVLRTAPNGDVFVAESGFGRIRVIRAGTAAPPTVSTFLSGLMQPYGIAFYPPGPSPEFVYIGTVSAVIRVPYVNGDLTARGMRQTVVALPAGGHLSRDIAFTLDGASLLIAVGSASNNNDDGERTERNRANILETSPDGGEPTVFAAGLRNPSGIGVDPSTGEIWVSVNERDGLGDNLPPDFITHVERGGFYGWPWYYIGGHWDPIHTGKHPELRSRVIVPDVLVQPHNASLTFTFYKGDQFPAYYRGDIFAVNHGSWNRGVRTGYEVIRVRRAFGRATGEYEDFLTGFVTSAGQVWGRPSGVTATADGSLLVSDDGSGSIWRVRWTLGAGLR
jgi:glucose/arabinose dehydrogenase